MTFAGGTMSQAMAKHKYLKGEKEKDEKGKKPEGDGPHSQHSEPHTKGTLSSTQQKDPRKVDEEEEAPESGAPGGEGMRGTGY